MANIPDFEGRPVRRSTLKITKAGDGLSEALALEPIALHHGDDVTLVLRGKVKQVNHRENGDDLIRQHSIETQEASLVDPETVEHILRDERQRVTKLRDEQAGQLRLADEDEE